MPTPLLLGEYGAENPGPIAQFTFVDMTHYTLVWSSCDGQPAPCSDRGTFAVNDAAATLSLSSDVTGQSTVLPFHVVAAPGSASMAYPIRLEGGPSLVGGDAGSLISEEEGTLLCARQGGCTFDVDGQACICSTIPQISAGTQLYKAAAPKTRVPTAILGVRG